MGKYSLKTISLIPLREYAQQIYKWMEEYIWYAVMLKEKVNVLKFTQQQIF